jgi:clan AA aspartic protease (TIGR02281 family)
MKRSISQLIIGSQIAIAILMIAPYQIFAQPNNCYMEDTGGGLIDLSSLCGKGNSIPYSPSQSNSGSFSVTIKRRHSGIPVVDVLFNRKKTYEMLVDTGASGTVLTVRMAEELGLQPEGYALVQTPSSQAVAMGATTIESIRVGNGEIRNVQVIVSPSLPIGLLGQDFFANYNITIKENRIEFQRR